MASIDLEKIGDPVVEQPRDFPPVHDANVDKLIAKFDELVADIEAIQIVDNTQALTLVDLNSRMSAVETALAVLDNTYATDAELATVQTQLDILELAVNNLDNTYATDTQVASISANLQQQIDLLDTTTGGGFATDAQLATAVANLSGAIDAIESDAGGVTYDGNPNYTTVEEALNSLLYVAIDITSWSRSGASSTYEVGDTANITGFTWATNKNLNGDSPTVEVDKTSPTTVNDIVVPALVDFTGANSGSLVYAETLNPSSATTYSYRLRLTETDPDSATQQDSSTTSVAFRWRRHWGVSSNASLTSGDILTLPSSELSTNNNKTFTVSPSAEYIYFVHPTSFGTTSFVVGGLSVTFDEFTVSHTNAFGVTTNYYVYRSQTVQNGSGIVVEAS